MSKTAGGPVDPMEGEGTFAEIDPDLSFDVVVRNPAVSKDLTHLDLHITGSTYQFWGMVIPGS